MMKQIFLSLFFFVLIQSAFGQVGEKIGLDPKTFKKTLNQQFSNLITGLSTNSIGNFASVDLKDAEVSFGGSSIFKNGSVLTIKAAGGVTDGLYSIFTNSKLNSQVSLDVKYHFLTLSKQQLNYNFDSLVVYNASSAAIERDYRAKDLAITYSHRQDSINLLQTKYELDSTIKALEGLLKPFDTTKMSKLSDSLHIAKGTAEILRDSICYALDNYPSIKTSIRQNNNARTEAIDNLNFSKAVKGFSFGWFSIGYKVSDNSFKFFDSSRSFDAQVMDTSFVSHAVSVQFSHYKYSSAPYRSLFWDAGLAFSISDNFSSLLKKEISESSNIGSIPSSRSITDKYNAYQGSYTRNLKIWRTYADLYYFLFKNNTGALHLFPEWIIKDKEIPLGNFGVGFLFSFKDSKTDGAVVNAELYYNLLDLFNSTNSPKKLFERNDIGIRFAFPLQFK